MTPTKKDFAALIDAYADAKASRNTLLVNMAKVHVENALEELFKDEEKTEVVPEQF
jgi:hypothetical protein